jgi:tetratricopeptide (TPR) repeat protein
MKVRRLVTAVALATLGACSVTPKDDSPTLKSLEKRSVQIDRTGEVAPSIEKAREGYEALLQTTTDEALRTRAMRRLADLNMQERDEVPGIRTESQAPVPAGTQGADFEKAVKLYESLLKSMPDSKDNDRILYQLARAYEQLGELEKSLDTLTRLVTQFPKSVYHDEAQFRRGETLFAFQNFPEAANAYADSLQLGRRSPFFERATYKHGWALYKQDRYADALPSFLALLDLKLANRRLSDSVADYAFLSKGDKELVLDALRVVSLCFSYLQGARTVNDFVSKASSPPNYEFLLYRSLGDLYLRQERFVDAAQAYSAFGTVRPEHPQSLLMQIDSIEIYQDKRFADRVLESKKDLIGLYGKHMEYWADNTHYGFDQYLIRGNDALQQKIEDYIVATLEELGKFYHNRAQKTKSPQDYAEAIKWYQTFLRAFLQNPKAAEINFLLAEALFEDKRYADAIREYEKTAYNYNRHKQSADAGYAALQTYEEYKKTLEGEDLEFWDKLSLQSSERFSKLFPRDPRTPTVLVKVVNDLFEKQRFQEATVFAERILLIAPDSDTKVRMQAMSIIAQTRFEEGKFQEAEQMYANILNITPPNDKNRPAVEDRLAASIYKQGEALRDQGDLTGSTDLFLRIASAAPASAIRATAEYDAAANLIALKQWDRAIPILESFQNMFPNHQYQSDVTKKLAVAYLESGNNARAADYLQKIASNETDRGSQQDAIWQSAELYEKGGATENAIAAYKRYLTEFKPPYDNGIEARQRIIGLYGKLGQPNSQRFWQKDLVAAATPTTPALSDRARVFAANAAMALAEPTYDAFHGIRLTIPLKTSVAKKRKAMDDALKAFEMAAAYRVAEVTTAATYRSGEIYNEFSKAILASDRPQGLSADALEQYELVLEEQAFPFEEKAIELHEANAARTAQGLYDDWIKKSFAALAGLLPARYGKTEKAEAAINEIN